MEKHVQARFAAEVVLNNFLCMYFDIAACLNHTLVLLLRSDAPLYAQLMLRSRTLYFTSQSVVASCKNPADRLMVVASGVAEIILPPRTQKQMDAVHSFNQGHASPWNQQLDQQPEQDGWTLLRVITRGYVRMLTLFYLSYHIQLITAF